MLLKQRLFAAEKIFRPNKGPIAIAFLDTGISPVADFTHPKNRIIAFLDLIDGKTAPYDDNGHGTHVTVVFRKRKKTLFHKGRRSFSEFNMSYILLGIDEGHRASTIIMEHTKCCHQNDAAVQQTL